MNRLLNTEQGKIIISVIWGLGLAFLFFKQTCKGDHCVVYSAPPANTHENIFALEDQCYQFVPYNVKCEKSKRPIPHRD
jgi:hypothetical protein